MIRTAAIGVLVCMVTVASGYAGTVWRTGQEHAGVAGGKDIGKMTNVKIKPISIPVVEHGKVTGYIIAQFTFISPAETLKDLTVKPEVFLLDAAFQGIYTGRDLDIKKLTKESWSGLTTLIKNAVNARFGSEVLYDVVLEDFGYIAVDQVRGGQKMLTDTPAGEGKKSKTKASAH